MTVSSAHPAYSAIRPDWQRINDCYGGERVVKAAGSLYLPPTHGHLIDGYGTASPNAIGNQDYDSYRLRAVFPDYIYAAVSSLVGVMHKEPPEIKLPAKLESLRNRATVRGESLASLLRRINHWQIRLGRVGLLADPPSGRLVSSALPRFALYEASSIINWDTTPSLDSDPGNDLDPEVLDLVVLDESGWIRKPDGDRLVLDWQSIRSHRVLRLGPSGSYEFKVVENDGDADFGPWIRAEVGGRPLNQIPFVFINATDLVPVPDVPPLNGLANLSMTIYRGEADYRHHLHMQAQETFVVTGHEEEAGEDSQPRRLGAGAQVVLANESAKAYYVGIKADGLSEQREALSADHERAAHQLVGLLDTKTRQAETGGAMRTRMAARIASLESIAQAGAAGLQEALRQVAVWMGEDPEEVVVRPNTDFIDDPASTAELAALANAIAAGIPLSRESVHGWLKHKEFTKLSFAQEEAKIKAEHKVYSTASVPSPVTVLKSEEPADPAAATGGSPSKPPSPSGARSSGTPKP